MRDVAATHNYGKTVNNNGSLYVAGYYSGTVVNCTNVYYRGPEESPNISMRESGYISHNLLLGNYTILGPYDNTFERNIDITIERGKMTYAQLNFGGIPPSLIQTGYAPVKVVYSL